MLCCAVLCCAVLCCAALRLRCAALRCACACACVCAVPALRLRESEESWYGSLQPATTTARWGASRLTTSTRPLGCAANAIFCALILDPSQSVSHHRHTAHTAPPSMLTCLRAGAQRAWRSGVCLLVQVRCAANCLSWLLHCFLWFLVVASWGVCTSSGGDLAATARRCPLGATACLTPPPIPAPNPSPLSFPRPLSLASSCACPSLVAHPSSVPHSSVLAVRPSSVSHSPVSSRPHGAVVTHAYIA